ncbi:hypothetical protein PENTCL1PPCAC_13911, partial [Pristionchus entomophagus]
QMVSHSAEYGASSLIPGRSFAETVSTLIIISSCMIVLHGLRSILGDDVVGLIAPFGALFCYHWLAVHSYKLSRKCNLVFDEANLLSLSTNFEYELGFRDDCVTPANRVEVKIEPPKPTTLWEALFFDDRAYKMEEFYRQMYSGEYERAMRRDADERARRAADVNDVNTPMIPSKISPLTTSEVRSTIATSKMTSSTSSTPSEKKE